MEVAAYRRQTRSTCRKGSRAAPQSEAQQPAHDCCPRGGVSWSDRSGLLLVESAGGTAAGRASANLSPASPNQFSRIAKWRREDKFRCRPMKSRLLASFTFGLCILFFASSTASARLPRPYQHQGIVALIESDARMIVLAKPPKPKFRLGKIIKPTTFVWNDRTQFIKSGQPADATALAPGSQMRLEYYYPPKKGRPVLVQIVWEGDKQ